MMEIIDRIKLNLKLIFKESLIISSALFSIIAILLTFISWTDIGIRSICCRIVIFIGVLLLSILFAALYILFLKNSHVVWECGNGKIRICYGDIMKKAFPRKIRKERIVVIPVNTCFDTIVDKDIASVEKPIVSCRTIHGQWITEMINAGTSRLELDQRINSYFKERDIKPLHELSKNCKKRGNLLSYKRGAVVALSGENKVTFFLLALSEFDENNNAQCSKDEFSDCIKELIEFYNKNGQGFEIYLPLMGTNLSRVGLTHSEALRRITALFELHCDQIHGEVSIVVYSKDKDKVSIFNT